MDKREQILQAALKLFVEFGFHGTPTSRIAQEAGVSNGTLFHYFKTKDDLVMELFIHIKVNLAACFEFDQKEGETVKNTFKRVYLEWVYWALDNPVEFKFIKQFHSSPYLSMVSDQRIQDQMSKLMGFMQDSIDARILKPLPVDFLFTLINNHVDGLVEYLVATKLETEKQKEMIHLSFDLIWDMLT
jgi:AcrR family transcriptional regulator